MLYFLSNPFTLSIIAITLILPWKWVWRLWALIGLLLVGLLSWGPRVPNPGIAHTLGLSLLFIHAIYIGLALAVRLVIRFFRFRSDTAAQSFEGEHLFLEGVDYVICLAFGTIAGAFTAYQLSYFMQALTGGFILHATTGILALAFCFFSVRQFITAQIFGWPEWSIGVSVLFLAAVAYVSLALVTPQMAQSGPLVSAMVLTLVALSLTVPMFLIFYQFTLHPAFGWRLPSISMLIAFFLLVTTIGGAFYPLLVLSNARLIAGREPYCIYLPNEQRTAESSSDLTFYALGKSRHTRHAVLVVDGESGQKVWYWSYHKSHFLPIPDHWGEVRGYTSECGSGPGFKSYGSP